MKCSICGTEHPNMENFLFEDKPICTKCAGMLDIISTSNDKEAIKRAVNYLYRYTKNNPDREVTEYLKKDVLDTNASMIEEMEKGKSEDYFNDRKQQKSASIPIPGVCGFLDAFSWICFIGGTILAFFVARLSDYADSFNWPVFIGILASSILSGCLLMSISYIVEYLAIIAYNTGRRKK